MYNQVFTSNFVVLPKFTVDVYLPTYVVTTDKEMRGTVMAK